MAVLLIRKSTVIILYMMVMITTIIRADYRIGWIFRMYTANPNNTLANGSCCEDNCSECRPLLKFCFRDSGHSHEDIQTCSLDSLIRTSESFFIRAPNSAPNILQIYHGSFQVYIRVAQDSGTNPSFDLSDPLIDNIFFEFTEVAPTGTAVIQDETGDFGRVTIELSVNVVCAEGFNGSDCNTFCEEIDSTLTCREIIVENMPTIHSTTTLNAETRVFTIEQDVTTDPPLVFPIERRDNTVAIAVGVSVSGAVVLILVVGVIIGAIFLVRRVDSGRVTTFYYTVRRAGSASSSVRDNTVGHSDSLPLNIEDMYSTVNKKSQKPPPLPPPYIPDDPGYQNLTSEQGRQGVTYANAGANDNHAEPADVTVSTDASHVNQDAVAIGQR